MPDPVAHACNPSYSGGKDLENHCSKPAWANSLQDFISKKKKKKKSQKRTGRSNHSTEKKKKKESSKSEDSVSVVMGTR
jgi:hypothetical protein